MSRKLAFACLIAVFAVIACVGNALATSPSGVISTVFAVGQFGEIDAMTLSSKWQVRIDTKAWEFSPGGANAPPLVLSVGNSYRLRFHNVDAAGVVNPDHGFTGISDLGISGSPGAVISPGRDFVTEVFTLQPFQRGTYPFQCTNNNCGGDPQQHASMTGILVVQ